MSINCVHPQCGDRFECAYDEYQDLNVCVRCGRYYAMTEKLIRLWGSTQPKKGDVMPQLCYNCMDGNSHND